MNKIDYPKISIITPSYNQGHFIEETILSVVQQRYPNLEYIIIDGGSTDETLSVIEKYKNDIDIVVSEKDTGQANAINKGFELASGEILCWLNSDDLFVANSLFDVAEVYINSGFGFLFGDGIKLFEDGIRRRRSKIVSLASFKKYELAYRDPLQQPSTFWSRAIWEAVGPIDESLHYAFDWDFFNRVNLICELTYLPKCLSIYRIHKSHKSGGGGYGRALEIVEVARRYSDKEKIYLYGYIIDNYKKAYYLTKLFRRYSYLIFYILSPGLYFNSRMHNCKYLVRMVCS